MMKKKAGWIWLVGMVGSFFCVAENPPCPALQGEKFVYLTTSGSKLWSEEWDWAWPFTEERAGVRRGPKWSLLDIQGRKVGEAKFDWVGLFGDGLAPARQGAKWGYLNRQGQWAIAPFYSDARPFHQGVAAVQIGGSPNVVSKADQLLGLPEVYAKIPKKIDFQAPASSGGKWALINAQDQYVVPPKYEAILEAAQDLVLFKEQGAWGYLSLQGEVKIPAQFLKAAPFREGLAEVTLMNCRSGKIDRSGRWLEREKILTQELEHSQAALANVPTDSGREGLSAASSR